MATEKRPPQHRINGVAHRHFRWDLRGIRLVEYVDLLAQHGVIVSANHVTNIEAKRRDATDEFIAAAAAVLEIHPDALYRPDLATGAA